MNKPNPVKILVLLCGLLSVNFTENLNFYVNKTYDRYSSRRHRSVPPPLAPVGSDLSKTVKQLGGGLITPAIQTVKEKSKSTIKDKLEKYSLGGSDKLWKYGTRAMGVPQNSTPKLSSAVSLLKSLQESVPKTLVSPQTVSITPPESFEAAPPAHEAPRPSKNRIRGKATYTCNDRKCSEAH